VECEWAICLEGLNTVLDDNKVLGKGESEQVCLAENARVVLCASDCTKWSPANVSRVGVVQMN